MSGDRHDPHQIPDDTGRGGLVAYIGEDVLRGLTLRLTLLVTALTLLAAGTVGAAPDPARTAGLVVGGAGFLLVLVAVLSGWRRSRQWVVLLVVLVASGSALGVLLAHAP